MSFLRRSGVALVLSVLLGVQSIGPVVAEEEQTNLQIELVGLPLTGTQRAVQVRVTNVSKWWAQPTTARVETLKPTAGNLVDNIQIPDLDPGQVFEFTYTLDAPCNGHEIRAVVAPAQNYVGVQGVGNTTQKAVCAKSLSIDTGVAQAEPAPNLAPSIDRDTALTQPAPGLAPNIDRDGALTKPAPDFAPEYLRPGTHAIDGRYPPLTLKPSYVRSVVHTHVSNGVVSEAIGDITKVVWEGINGIGLTLLSDAPNTVLETVYSATAGRDSLVVPSGYVVGWAQDDGTIGSRTAVGQTAAQFDLTQIDQIAQTNPFVVKAVLSFDERELRWTDGGGNRRQVKSCVNIVGIASFEFDPRLRGNSQLFFNQAVWNDAAGSREWDVASNVRDQVLEVRQPGWDAKNNADLSKLRHGYVLQGGLEDVQGHDNDSCLSEISNLQLTLTYVVPD